MNNDYQYDSCISRGICSINPRTASLQEVLILYLKLTAHYALKLFNKGVFDENSKNIIMNTISIMVSNYEFSEKDFKALMGGFSEVLPKLIKKYDEISDDKDKTPEALQPILKFNNKTDIIKAIQLGEKEFLKKSKKIPSKTRDLYKILFVLAKSVCINVFDIESLDIESEEGYLSILNLLSDLYLEESNTEKIKESIFDIAEVDYKLMRILHNNLEKRYGKSGVAEVSYSTTPGKAILVVGSNLKELEDILLATKDKNIDIYTHGEMILANTYPYFQKFVNFKGQFGQGVENCLLDFATFPGPIILTRHSLYNIEHLYRGLLYTTDFASSKGVIPIKNRDFSDVIEAAEKSRGFKTGKQCESVTIGFDYDNLISELEKTISKYSRIFIIGQASYTLEEKAYFEKLLNQAPENVLVLSMSYCSGRKNIINLNACYDSFITTKIAEACEKFNLPITIFLPKCDRHSLSQIVYLSRKEIFEIFIGKCTPIMINPNMISTFKDVFGIKSISSVKKDLESLG